MRNVSCIKNVWLKMGSKIWLVDIDRIIGEKRKNY